MYACTITEFYEEALSLLYELTCREITPDIWAVLEVLYEVSNNRSLEFVINDT